MYDLNISPTRPAFDFLEEIYEQDINYLTDGFISNILSMLAYTLEGELGKEEAQKTLTAILEETYEALTPDAVKELQGIL